MQSDRTSNGAKLAVSYEDAESVGESDHRAGNAPTPAISESYEDALFDAPVSDRVFLVAPDDDAKCTTGSRLGIKSREAELVFLLRDAARVVRRMARAKHKVFKVVPVRKWRAEHQGINKKGLAGDVCNVLRALRPPEVETYFPGHRLNPYVDLLFRFLRERPKLQCVGNHWDICPDGMAQEVADMLNELVDDLRTAVQSKAFRKTFDQHRRRLDRNSKSLRDYIDSLFISKSRHLVIRLDLGYAKAQTALGTLTPTSITLEQARRNLAQLVRHVREQFPMTGYAWKLECGLQKGYHFHLLLFLDGHVVRQDVTVARQLGEHWQKIITEGQGRYFNCNACEYRNRGVGEVNYDDGVKRAALVDYVAPYLTKVDFWMYFSPAGKTFGRGLTPAPPSGVGRPRA